MIKRLVLCLLLGYLLLSVWDATGNAFGPWVPGQRERDATGRAIATLVEGLREYAKEHEGKAPLKIAELFPEYVHSVNDVFPEPARNRNGLFRTKVNEVPGVVDALGIWKIAPAGDQHGLLLIGDASLLGPLNVPVVLIEGDVVKTSYVTRRQAGEIVERHLPHGRF